MAGLTGITKPKPKTLLSTQSREALRSRLRKILAEAAKRRLPANHLPEVDADKLEASELLLRQFDESDIRVARLAARKLIELIGSSSRPTQAMLRSQTFLRSGASFYDLQLLVSDPKSYKQRLKLWQDRQQQERLKSRSHIDIGATVALDMLYTRAVCNESNLYSGRHTLANVD